MLGQGRFIAFSHLVRRSQITLFDNLFLPQLNEAEENITEEMKRLETAENAACQVVDQAFEEAVKLLDKRRQAYVSKIKETAAAKLGKLGDQIDLIEKEKSKVREYCDGLEYQVEVTSIFCNVLFVNRYRVVYPFITS